ncbi:signal peptidase I [Niveibacterium microcysteis]|uniref:Signal peptidase I n=1 Tax=Niveibacterium microcysteis TaxID=2811415 RepID=A0ABX7M522_9RHOO|nr:signal peptidase I [Niveibacterium microcysteis]QSI76036.1 signal peptidase I [Niveibacterium microcysteis]
MKNWLKQNRGFVIFLVCLGLFRTAMADWNPVPTGSMRPTILEGDVVLVNRLAYDVKLPLTNITLGRLGDPQRGDIVTFNSPKDGSRLIKRLVALPGDVVAMRDDVLYINGQAARYSDLTPAAEQLGTGITVPALRATETVAGQQRTVQFLDRVGAKRSFGPLVVPPEHYFMLGDNRDNSEDSRYIGVVPRDRIIGRANHILVSADITDHWQPRPGRFASALN